MICGRQPSWSCRPDSGTSKKRIAVSCCRHNIHVNSKRSPLGGPSAAALLNASSNLWLQTPNFKASGDGKLLTIEALSLLMLVSCMNDISRNNLLLSTSRRDLREPVSTQLIVLYSSLPSLGCCWPPPLDYRLTGRSSLSSGFGEAFTIGIGIRSPCLVVDVMVQRLLWIRVLRPSVIRKNNGLQVARLATVIPIVGSIADQMPRSTQRSEA